MIIFSKATRSIAVTAARNVSVRHATTFSTRAAAPASSKFYGVAAASTIAVVAYHQNNKSSYTIAHCDALPVYGVPGTNLERTFLAVKPDGVQRALIGDIIARFEKRGYKLVGLKMVWPHWKWLKPTIKIYLRNPSTPDFVHSSPRDPSYVCVGRERISLSRVDKCWERHSHW